MTAVLPTGHTFRRPTKNDAEAIFELVAARNTAVVGFADFTLDDMADELTGPGFDLDRDGWLVFAGETLVGYGSVFGQGDHHLLDIDLYATGGRASWHDSARGHLEPHPGGRAVSVRRHVARHRQRRLANDSARLDFLAGAVAVHPGEVVSSGRPGRLCSRPRPCGRPAPSAGRAGS